MQSRDNVRQQVVLDQGDLVLELQLALFEARDLELVLRTCLGQRSNGCIEIAMLRAQQFQPLAKLLFGHSIAS